MWDPPRPGLEPVLPALAGRFLTTVPPGKPWILLGLGFRFWQSWSRAGLARHGRWVGAQSVQHCLTVSAPVELSAWGQLPLGALGIRHRSPALLAPNDPSSWCPGPQMHSLLLHRRDALLTRFRVMVLAGRSPPAGSQPIPGPAHPGHHPSCTAYCPKVGRLKHVWWTLSAVGGPARHQSVCMAGAQVRSKLNKAGKYPEFTPAQPCYAPVSCK